MVIEGFNLFMIYFTSLVVVFNFACSVLVYRKYLIRKTELIRTLSVLFFLYCLYMTFNIIEVYIVLSNPDVIAEGSSQIITFPMTSAITSNPFLISYSIFYTLDLVFASLTSILVFKFKLLTFARDVEKKENFTKFVNGLGWVALFFSCCAIISINNNFMGFVGFLITLHLFLVYGSFTITAFKTYNIMKTHKEDKEYIKAFLYIALMPLSFILRNVSLYLNQITIYIQFGTFPDFSRYSIFFLIAWAFLVVAYIVGYLGYVRPGQKQKA